MFVDDTAVWVAANDVEELAVGLLKVIALPKDQRMKMGHLAKALVKTEFSIEKAIERFEGIYGEVLNGHA